MPSASSLLAELPEGLLGRAENIIVEGEDDVYKADRVGTKYNAVAPPSNVAQITEEEKWRLKPSLSMEKQAKEQEAKLKKINKNLERQARKDAKQAAKNLPQASVGSNLTFAPRQIGGKSNVSTEDLEGMGMKRRKVDQSS